MLRYPCLVLDHDDTVVDSTAHVHYPAFVAAMASLRPQIHLTLDEYFQMNCDPGIHVYWKDVLCLNEEEARLEYQCWQQFVASRIPSAFPGMREVIVRQKQEGGLVCVVSHSRRETILRDYAKNGLPQPDAVFGSELPREQQKPACWPVRQIMDCFHLAPDALLVVDDLRTGFEMAQAAHIDFAAACWAHHVPEIRLFMKKNSQYLLETPADLFQLLFACPNG